MQACKLPPEMICEIVNQSDLVMQTVWSFVCRALMTHRIIKKQHMTDACNHYKYDRLINWSLCMGCMPGGKIYQEITRKSLGYSVKSFKIINGLPIYDNSTYYGKVEAAGSYSIVVGKALRDETQIADGFCAAVFGRNNSSKANYAMAIGHTSKAYMEASMAHAGGIEGSQEIKVHVSNLLYLHEMRLAEECYAYLNQDGAALVTAKLINVNGNSCILRFVVRREHGVHSIVRFDSNESICTENAADYTPYANSNGFTVRLKSKVKTTGVFKMITVSK